MVYTIDRATPMQGLQKFSPAEMQSLVRPAVEAGMAAVSDDDYLAVLADVAGKKLQELRRSVDDTAALRQKLTAFLLSRGFLISEINQIITNTLQQ